MKLLNLIARFRKDEDGAVTVDFVVLTAGVVVVAIGLATFFSGELADLATQISADIGDYDPDPGL